MVAEEVESKNIWKKVNVIELYRVCFSFNKPFYRTAKPLKNGQSSDQYSNVWIYARRGWENKTPFMYI